MNWEAMGAIGETLGAAGVIITLIYLATQLRQNTKALRASSYESYAGMVDSVMGVQVQYPAPFTKLRTNEELSADEQTIISGWSFRVFNNMETTYLHHREGLLDEDVYEARVRGFTSLMTESPSAQIMRQTWESNSKYAFTDGFVQLMNERIVKPS